MSAPLLRVEGLTKSFGALAVTDDVTFSVNEAGLVALIGPNGAGKTTLINQLSGALQPDAGKISFGGLDICALDMRASSLVAEAVDWSINQTSTCSHIQLFRMRASFSQLSRQ